MRSFLLAFAWARACRRASRSRRSASAGPAAARAWAGRMAAFPSGHPWASSDQWRKARRGRPGRGLEESARLARVHGGARASGLAPGASGIPGRAGPRHPPRSDLGGPWGRFRGLPGAGAPTWAAVALDVREYGGVLEVNKNHVHGGVGVPFRPGRRRPRRRLRPGGQGPARRYEYPRPRPGRSRRGGGLPCASRA